VPLTITEGGYNTHPVTGEFDASDPEVAPDLERGAVPCSMFGLVNRGTCSAPGPRHGPFTVMSCDNIPGNGDVARQAFTTFAGLRDGELGEWVGRAVAFPNSMVDRITPVTTQEDRTLLSERFGVEDAWPVVCEPFTQWVLEDSFADGRQRLQDAGVQLVGDVEPRVERRKRFR